MKKIWAMLVALILAAAALTVGAAEAVTIDSEIIDHFIEEEMKISNIPGLALGIVYNGEPVYVKGYGTAGKGRAVNEQTPFIIGSASKSFTALATMQLVESCKLELDRPVQDYLPWFAMAGAYNSGEITVRHLLVQTSGIPNEAGVSSLARSSIYTTEEEIRALNNVPLADKPGNSYVYSNANYNILGLLINQLSESGYKNHVQENIFIPLEMNNSFLSRAKGVEAGLADGYTKVVGFPVAGEVQYLDSALAAGFIISTAEDMCRYLLMHLNGGKSGGNEILSESGLMNLYRPGAVEQGNSDYAMGLVAVEDEGNKLIMHDGMTQGFNSGFVFSPEGRWGVVVLTNVGTMIELPAMPLALAVADLIRGETPQTGAKTSRNYYFTGLLVVFVLLVLTIRSLILLPKRWVYRLKTEYLKGFPQILLWIILPVVLEASVPLIVFLMIPVSAGFPVWQLLGLYHPDLVWGLLIITALLLVKVIWRLVIIFSLRTN